MRVTVSERSPLQVEADALVAGVFKEGLDAAAAELDTALGGALSRLVADGEIKGEPNQTALYHADGRLPARRIVLVGLGDRSKVDAERVRQAAGAASRLARDKGCRRVALTLLAAGAAGGEAAVAEALVEGALLGLHRLQNFKTKPEEKAVDEVIVAAPSGGVREAVARAEVTGRAVCLARDLAFQPGNRMTPRLLAEAAERMAAGAGIEIEVLDERRIEAEGMGALLGVARGSHEPPRFIVMRYRSGRPNAPLLALVGKGLTFDSGGISIKPAEGMEEMRMDKSGGAAVIGALQAIARLRPALDVVGIVPATENLPGGGAQKPGDVVTACNGKTIEVINTDAEGRLILADAVAYAAKLGARWIVDIATLTGAVVICLGSQAAAVVGNDQALVDAVIAAGRAVGERLWQLPAYDEYKEQYKSSVADIKNVGGRPAGTITGALIVGEFVGETAWAHLDIAGVAWHDKDLPYKPAGATGFGVRTLVRLAQDLAASGGDGGA